jgi:predicted transcriptional regulator of viral defense system
MRLEMRLEKFFRQRPVFTNKEFAEFLEAKGQKNVRTQESTLEYHTKTGRLLRVRRGLYAVVPPGANPETYPIDPYLLAAKMTEDAVLGYHTALEFHGKAYSVYEHFFYLTAHSPRPGMFRSLRFRAVPFPKPLRKRNEKNFGVAVAERAGLDVRVTSLERTLVDVLDRPDLAGSWEEIWRSLESVEFFDLKKILEYTLLLENATTAAKVGYFLEEHRESLMVEESHLMPLRELRPRQPHYLDRAHRKKGRLVKDWNLVVPKVVVERSWAEIT